MLSWHSFQQAKTYGQLVPLQKSCEQLMDALELQPSKNTVNLTNYRHDLGLSEQRVLCPYSRYPTHHTAFAGV